MSCDRRSNRRADLLDGLARFFADDAAVRALIARAPSPARGLLGDGGASVIRLPADRSWYRPASRPTLDTAHGWLIAHGLAVASYDYRAAIPLEVGLALRGGVVYAAATPDPPAVHDVPIDIDGVDARGAAQAGRLVRSVARLLGALDEAPAVPLKAGGLAPVRSGGWPAAVSLTSATRHSFSGWHGSPVSSRAPTIPSCPPRRRMGGWRPSRPMPGSTSLRRGSAASRHPALAVSRTPPTRRSLC